ncbi:MAG: hypothetical protein J0L80_08900 [Chitinophagales bacterium]|nr:hypothetical protein [Chitinophagales bacterium]
MRKVISGLAILLLLVSCSGRKSLSPLDYLKYMENTENGLMKIVTVGSYEYRIQFAPPEYLADRQFCKEMEQGMMEGYKKRMQEMKGHIFFLINIYPRNTSQQSINERITENAGATQRVMYYQQQAAGDIVLKAGTYEQVPATYVYEDNYGLSPYNTIVVGFTGDYGKEDLQLIFNDRYTHTPLIKAGFSKDELSVLPEISVKTN